MQKLYCSSGVLQPLEQGGFSQFKSLFPLFLVVFLMQYEEKAVPSLLK